MKTMNSVDLKSLSEKFEKRFKKKGRIFFAPSRINLIGEHIDYNGGKVMPCAIDIGTYLVASTNDENVLNLFSMNLDIAVKISLDDLSYKDENSWGNYVSGMVKYIREAGYEAKGLDILVEGNIPYGAGLSSSASLEMLIGKTINTFFNDSKIPPIDMVKFGQKVENLHLGLNSGIMDQFAINLGKENSFILIDTNSLEYEYVNIDMSGKKIVILNTNKSRSLQDSKYNERFQECKDALKIMKEYMDINNLCEIEDVKDLEYIKDEIIRRRATHVVEENLRVKEMIDAINKKDCEKMGEILNRSHKSLKENYEVTGLYLDSIVEGALESKYTLGARMTGAGFAGCAIALVEDEGIEEFQETVKKYYKEKTGLDAGIIFAGISGSPKEVGIK